MESKQEGNFRTLLGTSRYGGSKAYEFDGYTVCEDLEKGKNGTYYGVKVGDYFYDVIEKLDDKYMKYAVDDTDEALLEAAYCIYYEENNNFLYIFFDKYDKSICAEFIAKSVIEG